MCPQITHQSILTFCSASFFQIMFSITCYINKPQAEIFCVQANILQVSRVLQNKQLCQVLSLSHHFLCNPSHLLGCRHHACLVIHKAQFSSLRVCRVTVTAFSDTCHGTSDRVQNARHHTCLCRKVLQRLAYILECITCCVNRFINIWMDVYCL
jgi:hypothetical protein